MKIFYLLLALSGFIKVSLAQQSSLLLKKSLNPDIQPHILGQMYNNQLTTKSLLLQAARHTQARIYASNDTVVRRQYQEFIAQRRSYHKRLNKSNKAHQKQGLDLQSIAEEIDALEKALVRKSKGFVQLPEEYKPHTWQEVQRKLKPGEVAIEIIRSQQFHKKWTDTVHYVALIVTPKSKYPHPVFLKNGNELESEGLKAYLQSYGQDKVSFARFWQPIHQYLIKGYSKVNKVYLSSGGVYHRLNIETLHDPATNQFVLDYYAIERVHNTKSILRETKKDTIKKIPSKQQALLFGDSLLGTQQEVQRIRQLLQSKQWKVHSKPAKSLKDRLRQVPFSGKLHIATHGYFITADSLKKMPDSAKYQQNPMLRSGLWWSKKANAQDKEILNAYEASNLNLNRTELVVLSADETALGLIQNGEGAYGLTRAMHAAGAQYIMASLWKINRPATTQLMQYFYKLVSQGKNYHEALRMAKQSLRKTYPHPKDWGAFVLWE